MFWADKKKKNSTQVFFEGGAYERREDESVLDCLLRAGLNIPHSCKAGACHCCLMKASEGEIPPQAQNDLKATQKQQNFFLACQCRPSGNISAELAGNAVLNISSSISEKSFLNDRVLRLRLRPDSFFSGHAGQFINIGNGIITRSYSIANIPGKDGYLELHIRLIAGGKMSNHLEHIAKIGDRVTIQSVGGECFYAPEGDNNFPMILAGRGTGLAPLYGIVRDALNNEHKGEIKLYHGVSKPNYLYYVEKLQKLAVEHSNFSYIPCVLEGQKGEFYRLGNPEDELVAAIPADKKNTKVYLCGSQEFVNSARTKAFLAGVSNNNIYTDSFLPGS